MPITLAPTTLGNEAKLFAGEVTLDGSNPTNIDTGLRGIVAAEVTQKTAVAPGDDPSAFTVTYSESSGILSVHAWRNTGGTDPTLIASTNNTAVISVVAVGF
jgi:hypothetical protein